MRNESAIVSLSTSHAQNLFPDGLRRELLSIITGISLLVDESLLDEINKVLTISLVSQDAIVAIE